jgi:predicted RNase H-like HicB family nuclease
MRTENVEIYSDQSNAAVLRHPGRKFPGVLIQGDTLNALCAQASEALGAGPDAREELEGLRDALYSLLSHYKTVLSEHGIALPFVAVADV